MSGGLNIGRWRVELRASVANDTELNLPAFDTAVATWGIGNQSPLMNKARLATGVSRNPNTEVRQNRTTFRNEITSAVVLDVTAPVGRNELADACALALQAGRVTGIDRAALATALATGRAVSTAVEAPFTRGSITLRRLGNVSQRTADRSLTQGTPASTEGGNRVATVDAAAGAPVAPVAQNARETIQNGPVVSASDPERVGVSTSLFSADRIRAAARGDDWYAVGAIIAAIGGVAAVVYLAAKD